MVKSRAYVFSKNNYLRIEPIGTTYSLTVEGGEGSGLYTAGSEVKISAEPYNSQEHFTGWTVTGANADDVLTDSTAASTTITVPAGGVTVTANYAAHTLEEHATKAPTCTEVGWEAYESCACGYSTYKEIPATGHTPGTGWHSNDENHWHECTVCSSETDEAAHDYEWVTDKESTATEAGSKHEQCSVCGYAKAAVEIPATGTDKPSDEKPTGDSDEPDTGDNSNILMWAALMSVSAAGLAFMAAKHRKAVRENQ